MKRLAVFRPQKDKIYSNRLTQIITLTEADSDSGSGVIRDLHGALVLVLRQLRRRLHQPLVAVGLDQLLGPAELVVLAVLHDKLDNCVSEKSIRLVIGPPLACFRDQSYLAFPVSVLEVTLKTRTRKIPSSSLDSEDQKSYKIYTMESRNGE